MILVAAFLWFGFACFVAGWITGRDWGEMKGFHRAFKTFLQRAKERKQTGGRNMIRFSLILAPLVGLALFAGQTFACGGGAVASVQSYGCSAAYQQAQIVTPFIQTVSVVPQVQYVQSAQIAPVCAQASYQADVVQQPLLSGYAASSYGVGVNSYGVGFNAVNPYGYGVGVNRVRFRTRGVGAYGAGVSVLAPAAVDVRVGGRGRTVARTRTVARHR